MPYRDFRLRVGMSEKFKNQWSRAFRVRKIQGQHAYIVLVFRGVMRMGAYLKGMTDSDDGYNPGKKTILENGVLSVVKHKKDKVEREKKWGKEPKWKYLKNIQEIPGSNIRVA